MSFVKLQRMKKNYEWIKQPFISEKPNEPDIDIQWDEGEIPWEFNDTIINKNKTFPNNSLHPHGIAFLFI